MSILDTLFKNQPKPLPEFRIGANYTVTPDDLQDQDDIKQDEIISQITKFLDNDDQCATDLKIDKIKNGKRVSVTFRRANIFRRSEEADNKNDNIRIAFCDKIEGKTLKHLNVMSNTDPANLVETTRMEVDVYDQG